MTFIEQLERYGTQNGLDFTRKLGAGGMGAVYLMEGEIIGQDGPVASKLQPIVPRRILPPHEGIIPVDVDYVIKDMDQQEPGHIIVRGLGKSVSYGLGERDFGLLQFMVSEREALKKLQAKGVDDVVGFKGHRWFSLEGHPYSALFMDYLDCGKDLATLLHDGISEALKYNVISSLGRAVDRLYNDDVVHGDVKPENVYVLPDGNVVLLDFGLAKLLRYEKMPNDPDDIGLLLTNSVPSLPVFGTLGYAAPSQLKGELCRKADSFGFGMTAYAILTGRQPRLVENGSLVENIDRNVNFSSAEKNQLMEDLVNENIPKDIVNAFGIAIHPEARWRNHRPLMKRASQRFNSHATIYDIVTDSIPALENEEIADASASTDEAQENKTNEYVFDPFANTVERMVDERTTEFRDQL